MRHRARRNGFTLIELLVVIAIIAILSAILMPALSSATDRSRVMQCRANLTHISIALRMYYNDQGVYPESLRSLYDAGLVTDDSMLVCTKTGTTYYYETPTGATGFGDAIASCVAPGTAVGKRPHSFRNSFVSLQRGGKVEEMGR